MERRQPSFVWAVLAWSEVKELKEASQQAEG